ncbi:hypothetical protein K788_00016865 [Paraburkholderia caribensis MBA4]|uniref:Uncharacterized protein n=1 Tax=Paraburkholderia caribensis MBA4 TaxID=1323664 RepID=A0A0P0RCB8_9BURK|nr:hypothetical protein K788_00016865 [Paraburkholderia caribensis MBA4]
MKLAKITREALLFRSAPGCALERGDVDIQGLQMS